jgi:multidrug transporter EmrE-like cation transporter
MKGAWGLIFFALLLSVVLTCSHALLRAASVYTTMGLPWIIRVATALFLYGLVFFAYTVLLKYYDISLLYPVYTALSIIGVTMVGIIFFGENFSLYKVLGLTLLIMGIGLISL